MTDGDGHEPQGLDRDFITEELCKGGALVRIQVRTSTDGWAGERIVPGVEMSTARLGRTDLVKLALRGLIETLDLEKGPPCA